MGVKTNQVDDEESAHAARRVVKKEVKEEAPQSENAKPNQRDYRGGEGSRRK